MRKNLQKVRFYKKLKNTKNACLRQIFEGLQLLFRYTVLEDLRFGRFSFKGQNPAVEKLMIYYECKRMGIDLNLSLLVCSLHLVDA
jgi:hypothetical protein